MPVPRLHPNGLGETLGDILATGSPLFIAADVWWVNGTTGTDAVSPAGKERLKPLATLAQAVTNAAAGDIIVLQDGHTETLTAALTISKRLTIVGSGQSDGKPTVKFTCNQAAGNLFTVSGSGVELRNLWIEENLQANSSPRIMVTGTPFRMIDCYVECDGNDDDAALSLGGTASDVDLSGTTFISTATSTAAVPESAVECVTGLSRVYMNGTVFSGGTVGFEDGYALIQTAATTQFMAEQISMLLGADFLLHESTVGWVIPSSRSGNPRIDWTGASPA